MPARLTQEVEKRSDAHDKSANRAHRLLAASTPVMDRLERDLERADVAIRAPRERHARLGSSGRAVSGLDLIAVEV
jgi:hypothetical protein